MSKTPMIRRHFFITAEQDQQLRAQAPPLGVPEFLRRILDKVLRTGPNTELAKGCET